MSKLTDEQIHDLFCKNADARLYDAGTRDVWKDGIDITALNPNVLNFARAIEAEIDEGHAQRLDAIQKILDGMEERQKLLRKVDALLNKPESEEEVRARFEAFYSTHKMNVDDARETYFQAFKAGANP
jgi:hypothetical protein